jgi:hypothetical protein
MDTQRHDLGRWTVRGARQLMRRRRAGRVLLAILCLGGIGACGGGGSGSVGSLPPGAFETEEYRANYGLGAIHASSAYAGGATGQGVTVAVIDSGIDVDHPEFAGAIHPDSIDIVTDGPTFDDENGHGTAVAGVIGARRNGALTHGVAYESRLLVVRADAPNSCGSGGCAFAPADVADATDHAVTHGAGVINYSLGGASVLDPTLEAALERAADAGRILVFAAGNEGASEPTFPARFAADAQAEGLAIAVGSVDANRQLATSSNRAGSAQEHYLVAPGVGILAPALGGGPTLFSGTSAAAPHVAGAAAVVLQAAPFLSGAQVVELLLDTAGDLGDPGTDPEYGRGLVDLDAALSPQGSLAVPLGSSVGGEALPLNGTGLRLGAAFGPGPELGRAIFLDGYGRPYWLDLGDATERAASLPDLHDWLAPARRTRTVGAKVGGVSLALGASASGEGMGVGGLAEREPADRDAFALSASLGESGRLDLVHGWSLEDRFGLSEAASGVLGGLVSHRSLSSPYLGLTRGGDGLALAQQLGGGITLKTGIASERMAGLTGRRQGTRALIAELSQETRAGTWLGLQLGSVRERDRLLDAQGGGALGLPEASSTSFIGLAGRINLPARVELFAQSFMGLTDPGDGAHGLLEDISALLSSSFGAGLARRDLLTRGDRLIFAVAQPLRIAQGRAVLDRPTGRTINGRVLRSTDRIDLEPAGREIDLEIGYRLPLGRRHELQVSWLSQIEPGHDPKARPAHTVALRVRAGL